MEVKEISITLKGKAVKQLENLRESTKACNSTEVVKNALTVYYAIQGYLDVDSSLVLETPKGKRIRLIIP